MRETTPAESEFARSVRDQLRNQWVEVRLLCPRGHYIADATVGVPAGDDGDNAPLWIWPRASNQPRSGNMGGNHGVKMSWHHDSQSTNVKLTCRNSRCSYEGTVNMFHLAVLAGASALGGAPEFTLFA